MSSKKSKKQTQKQTLLKLALTNCFATASGIFAISTSYAISNNNGIKTDIDFENLIKNDKNIENKNHNLIIKITIDRDVIRNGVNGISGHSFILARIKDAEKFVIIQSFQGLEELKYGPFLSQDDVNNMVSMIINLIKLNDRAKQQLNELDKLDMNAFYNDSKNSKDNKDNKESKESKDNKDSKDSKENKTKIIRELCKSQCDIGETLSSLLKIPNFLWEDQESRGSNFQSTHVFISYYYLSESWKKLLPKKIINQCIPKVEKKIDDNDNKTKNKKVNNVDGYTTRMKVRMAKRRLRSYC